SCHANGSAPEQWLNPNAFTLAGYSLGQPGDAGRGICEGPGIFQVDLALYKSVALGHRLKAQLRFEIFNLLDHAMFTDVNNVMNPITATSDTASLATASSITGFTLPSNFGVAS